MQGQPLTSIEVYSGDSIYRTTMYTSDIDSTCFHNHDTGSCSGTTPFEGLLQGSELRGNTHGLGPDWNWGG